MLRTKQAMKLLTKKEQAHLTASGINSVTAMTRQAKAMKDKTLQAVCFECKCIAMKLDFINKENKL